jgi:hypothetical protein
MLRLLFHGPSGQTASTGGPSVTFVIFVRIQSYRLPFGTFLYLKARLFQHCEVFFRTYEMVQLTKIMNQLNICRRPKARFTNNFGIITKFRCSFSPTFPWPPILNEEA